MNHQYKSEQPFAKNKGRKRKIEKVCNYCSELYFPNRSDQKYCSGSCRSLACKKRNNYKYEPRYFPVKEDAKKGAQLAGIEKANQVTLSGIGEAAIGSGAVRLLESLFIGEDDKPITKKEARKLIQALAKLINNNGEKILKALSEYKGRGSGFNII